MEELQLYQIHKLVNKKNTSSEEKKLELRLAPPGDDENNMTLPLGTNTTRITKNNFQEKDDQPSLLSLGTSFLTITTHTTSSGSKRGLEKCWPSESQTQKFSSLNDMNTCPWPSSSSQFYHQEKNVLPAVMRKESSCSKVMVAEELQNTEKHQAFSPDISAVLNYTAGPNISQKRTASSSVVGWPPIRSHRKNIPSNTSSKVKVETMQQNVAPSQKSASEKCVQNCCQGLFVKINMDGVPIGRKVDLKVYDSYEKLSCSVDELFRGLLAAQRDLSDDKKILNSNVGDKLITGLLDGRGEYTLVYEDNEGDRMLVGDVPWHMFVSTVKRLRILKSSELSLLSTGSSKQEKNSVHAAVIQQGEYIG